MSTLDMGLNPSTHKVFVPDHPAEGVTIENKKKTKEESGFFLSQLCTLASSRKCLAQEIWAEE